MGPERILLISLLGITLLASCGVTAPATSPTVRLNALSPLPTAQLDVVPLRVAVAAIISPQGTIASYEPLLTYLGHKLGRPVELVQRRTYAEANDLVRRNEVDLAFVCTRAFVQGERDFGMELLAVPQVHGETIYRSAVIVRADGKPATFDALRDGTFAFTDPLSNTGYLYPNVLLKRRGETPETFFRRTFFTYSHDRAVDAVAQGLADGAAVDSLVLEYALARDAALAHRIRIVELSPPYGVPPVVVSPEIRPQTRAMLQEILFNMQNEEEGIDALRVLDVDRFVAAPPALYDSVRMLEQEFEGK